MRKGRGVKSLRPQKANSDAGPASRKTDLTMAKTNPFEFLQEVRTEVSKVTWPTRRETVITTIMVVIMSILAALFFLAADWILSELVSLVLGFGI